MPRQLTCPQGHRWQLPDDPALPATRAATTCPQCGATPVSLRPEAARPRTSVLWLGLGVAAGLGLTGCLLAANAQWGWGVLLVVAGAAAAAGGVLYRTGADGARDRSGGLAETCRAMGLAFTEEASANRLAGFGPLDLFTTGEGRRARNLMEGRAEGLEVVLMEYEHWTSHKNERTLHRQTVAFFPGPASDLPDFQLGPNVVGQRLGLPSGTAEVRIKDNPLFSRLYRLSGPDEAAVRQWFTARRLQFFAQHQGWSVESRAGRLAVYQRAKRCKPKDFPTFLGKTVAIQRAVTRT